jgi:hypothetical protein
LLARLLGGRFCRHRHESNLEPPQGSATATWHNSLGIDFIGFNSRRGGRTQPDSIGGAIAFAC